MKFNPENSAWWVCDYAPDIHSYLLEREKECIKFLEQSPQLQFRRCLVDYLSNVCDHLKFCTTVYHLSVYYLDAFMDHHNVEEEHLQLIALGCLIVAVKVDEKDKLIPTMSDLNALVGNTYTLKEFVEIETSIMQFLNWELLVPTAATFVEYYLLFSLCPSDNRLQLNSVKGASACIEEYISVFLNVSIQDHSFRQFSSSIVAASCVVAARGTLSLSPLLPSSLRDITDYEITDLKPCVDLLICYIENEFYLCQSESNECTCVEDVGSPDPGESFYVDYSDSNDWDSSLMDSPCNYVYR